MKFVKRNETVGLIIISILISYYVLFEVGRMFAIRAYQTPDELPIIKRDIIILFVFSTFTISNYSLLKDLFKDSLKYVFRQIPLGIVALFLGLIASPVDYIRTGDYLRDVHGINWYYMDWGNWSVATSLYFASLYLTLVVVPIKKKITVRLSKRKKI